MAPSISFDGGGVMTTRIRPGALAIALAAALSAASSSGRPPGEAPRETLGQIDFPTSASGEARDHFVRGVLLLHSFMYDDAADEFESAQKAAPGFALAYWGEAMTKNHPLWMQRDAEAARRILEKLAPTRAERLAKTPTKREGGYLNAVEELYAEGDKAGRDAAYAAAMGQLHADFPEDAEAQSFYALSLLGSCEDHRDAAVYMRAAALAEEIFARNPSHPGAVHYLIHAYDDPVHAPLGLRPARVYAKIAGSAAHALHMPSHIFLALGMWDEVIASNEASWAAADERVARRKLGADERGWHGIYWREYALLQEGRVREARAAVGIAEKDAAGGLERIWGARDEMRATFAIETGCASWTPEADAPKKPRDHFVRGFCAWKKGDAAGLAGALAALPSAATEGKTAAGGTGEHAHGGTGSAYPASRGPAAEVMRMELQALDLASRGDWEGAAGRAKQAAAAEDALSFEFGPPIVVKPAHELAGEILLAARKPAEAVKEFRTALDRAPGRALSLAGESRAAAAAGDRKTAAEADGLWARNHRRADEKDLVFKDGFTPLEAKERR